jgi:hypothetical protein
VSLACIDQSCFGRPLINTTVKEGLMAAKRKAAASKSKKNSSARKKKKK